MIHFLQYEYITTINHHSMHFIIDGRKSLYIQIRWKVTQEIKNPSNKTSIQWTSGSQIDRSNQKMIFSKK